jgi:putative acetyltransferase
MIRIAVTLEHASLPEVASLLEQSDAVAARLYPGEIRRRITPQSLAKPGVHVVMARHAGKAVALCVLFDRGDGAMELKRMIVDEQVQGKGVGMALLRGAEGEALRLGAHTILLEVGIRNTGGQALYRRAGYQLSTAFPPYEASPLSLFMRRSL